MYVVTVNRLWTYLICFRERLSVILLPRLFVLLACPKARTSVRPSVGPSVRPFVRPSARPTFYTIIISLSSPNNTGFFITRLYKVTSTPGVTDRTQPTFWISTDNYIATIIETSIRWSPLFDNFERTQFKVKIEMKEFSASQHARPDRIKQLSSPSWVDFLETVAATVSASVVQLPVRPPVRPPDRRLCLSPAHRCTENCLSFHRSLFKEVYVGKHLPPRVPASTAVSKLSSARRMQTAWVDPREDGHRRGVRRTPMMDSPSGSSIRSDV